MESCEKAVIRKILDLPYYGAKCTLLSSKSTYAYYTITRDLNCTILINKLKKEIMYCT